MNFGGMQRSTRSCVKAPLPHPMSIHRSPDPGASQLMKVSPANWLQVPIIRSYAAPSSKRIVPLLIPRPSIIEVFAITANDRPLIDEFHTATDIKATL
jgi:hypothetical protein